EIARTGVMAQYTVVYNVRQFAGGFIWASASPCNWNSSVRVRRIGIEQLLAADLVVGNRFLPYWRHEPVDELLTEILFHIRMFLRIHQHHAILVEQALVARDQNREVGTVLERQPGSTIGEDVGAHRRGRVQR